MEDIPLTLHQLCDSENPTQAISKGTASPPLEMG